MIVPQTVKAVFTRDNEGITGLTAVITIINVRTGSVLINRASMQEINNGIYIYLFSTFDPSIDYHVICDSNDRSLDGRGLVYGGNDLFTLEFIDTIATRVNDLMNENWKGYPM